jgi:hypothetical protein
MQMYEDFLALIVAKILEAKKSIFFLTQKSDQRKLFLGFRK